MRETCTYGSEGGEARAFPTPIGVFADAEIRTPSQACPGFRCAPSRLLLNPGYLLHRLTEVFPAHAEMNRRSARCSSRRARVPRTRGDEPKATGGSIAPALIGANYSGQI